MSTVVTVERYEDLLRRSGLIQAADLDRVIGEMAAEGGRPTDTRILAKRLLEAKLITAWQNDKLMQGKNKGFFLGPYKLLQHLSKGGMSEVYLAEEPATRDERAIKIFPPNLIEQSSYLARFKQESRAQKSMDHPNIVKAYDFGCEGKIHYLVMEYIDGPDLNRLVEKGGPLAYRTAAEYIRQGADALSYAHNLGMVHRDIKPGNLMLHNRTGKVKLLDLGLARILDEEVGSLTLKHNENSLGTADYVAPEQAVDSHHVDHRADIYSLGGSLYFLLTGKPPFPEGTPVQRMMMHMNQDPTPITQFRPDCPGALQDIVKTMMMKRPEQRFETAAAVCSALDAWLRSPEASAPAANSAPGILGPTANKPTPAASATPRPTTARPATPRPTVSKPATPVPAQQPGANTPTNHVASGPSPAKSAPSNVGPSNPAAAVRPAAAQQPAPAANAAARPAAPRPAAAAARPAVKPIPKSETVTPATRPSAPVEQSEEDPILQPTPNTTKTPAPDADFLPGTRTEFDPAGADMPSTVITATAPPNRPKATATSEAALLDEPAPVFAGAELSIDSRRPAARVATAPISPLAWTLEVVYAMGIGLLAPLAAMLDPSIPSWLIGIVVGALFVGLRVVVVQFATKK